MSTCSTISTAEVQNIVDRLKSQRCRDSTRVTYHRIWNLFNKFFLKLDIKPESWEQRIILFTGYLVDSNLKSATIKTNVLALRSVLAEDGYYIDQNIFTITALTRACRIRNDKLIAWLPIHKEMLHLILAKLIQWGEKNSQHYLQTLYLAILSAGYHGLLRVGELTNGPHRILAHNVHLGVNKKKLLFILRTSKTHSGGQKPQQIKISNTPMRKAKIGSYCPFTLIQEYINMRPTAVSLQEQFFVFSDCTPVEPAHLQKMLNC